MPNADLDPDSSYERDPDQLRFYPNQSSTFILGDQYGGTGYWTNWYEGDLSHDEFRIAGLSVPNQTFINVQRSRPFGWVEFWYGFDGVLGLSPNWNTSRRESPSPSPWWMMNQLGLLERNCFALDMPHGPRDLLGIGRTGSITFGAVDSRYSESDFTILPISNYTDQAWTVQAHSITWRNRTHPIHYEFENFTLAGFDTAWYIGLPGSLADDIRDSVAEVSCGFAWCFVDCHARKHLPDLTIRLLGLNANRPEELTITAYDYAPEFEGPGKQSICLFEFHSTDDEYPVDAVVLSPNFLTPFYR